jgi:hypothetical protein
MNDLLIIGVDPGLACGFATLNNDVFTSDDFSVLHACTRLEELLRSSVTNKIVGVERFTFQASSAKKTRQYDALEFIGVARYLCYKHNATFLLQGASEAQQIGSRETLLKLGWWKKGYDHANKAAAQVVMAYARSCPSELESRIHPDMV